MSRETSRETLPPIACNAPSDCAAARRVELANAVFDVLEDLVGEFAPGGPVPPVENFDLHGREERLHYHDHCRVLACGLAGLCAGLADGNGGVRVAEGSFSLAEHRAFLAENADSIAAFRAAQREAMDVERSAWAAAGEIALAQQKAQWLR